MTELKLAGVGSDTPVRRPIDWRAPITLSVVAVLGFVVFGLLGRDQTVTFSWASRGVPTFIPDWVANSQVVGFATGVLMLVIAVYATWLAVQRRRVPGWFVAIFALSFLVALLGWVGAGDRVPFVYLLTGAIAFSVPVVLGALAGVLGERVGVVNIAIEGQLLAGAFSSAVVASITGNLLLGLVAAAIAGMLVSFVLAAFAIKYLVEQVIVGVVLNVLVTGLTGFLYGALLAPNEATLNRPVRFPRVEIPVLSDIPIIGPVLFNQTFIGYLMFITVGVVAWGLYRTRWGLRLRAVGEHPQAADTVGIKVNPTRFWNVLLAGAIAGMGGAYFTLVSVPQFGKDMTAGLGFIALAAVIFGRWDPIRATLAALLFGFATNLQNLLSILKTPIPGEFMLMLPYVVTLLAVAGFAGQIKAPAADGKPYIKS